MRSQHSQEVFAGVPLSLSSLRLLVPPLQLMTASMWQVIKQQDVVNYWAVSEFVSLVTEMVPELLLDKHRTQLNLGLRARYILELCRNDHLLEPDDISPYLDTIERLMSTPVNEVEVANVGANFLELVQTLLKNSNEREHFFREVFCVEYGPQYDADLQTLFWEFICRLAQLLPIPDLEQTVSWLGNAPSVLEECVHSVSEPMDLKTLLLHHKHLGHLEQHVPPLSMGDRILSSLMAFPNSQVSESTEKPHSNSLTEPYQTAREPPISFVDEVEVEVVTVTDYAEVELGTTCDGEVAIEGGCLEGADIDPAPVVPEEAAEMPQAQDTGREEVTVDEGMRGRWCQSGIMAIMHANMADNGQVPSPRKPSTGSHSCPDCDKSFKFASSLIAHRVIHTGERPHRCAVCGRCFSFRQSLERHKHVHKSVQKFHCVICGEAFQSQSAYMEHEGKHMADGVYTCTACGAKFTQDLAFVKHLKTHKDGHAEVDQRELTENTKDEQEVMAIAEKMVEVAVTRREGISQGSEVVDDCYDRTSQDVEKQTNDNPSTQPEVVSLVQVRSSGRKRKPTMKIHVLNLQKSSRKGLSPKKRQRYATETPPDVKPVPFNSGEHSYGSSVFSSKDGDGPASDGSSFTFSCPLCSFCHADEAQVLQHIATVHPGEAEDNISSSSPPLDGPEGHFNCPDCDKTFKFKSLMKVHRRVHTGERPYLCSQCGRSFSFKQSMERHKRTHKDGRQYECQICGEFFKSAAAQKDHRVTHMENGEYLCSKCGRAFAWKSALVRHLRTHGEGAEKTEHAHKCSHCDLTFSCATYLNRHLLTHKGERLHACVCGKSFAYRAALTAHQRIHQKERPHQCKQCGKGFLYKGGLQSHMKIHSEDMPYMCSFCGKSFKRERNMKKHERCHTGENVFSCSQCDKSFVYKATLIRHELTHSGERPFLCSDCGKGFFSHAELLKHERFHTGHKPFQCPHCGKKFTQSCYLTIHLRYHTGVRPYACPECDKSFLSANRLKRHQRTHTGEKPYTCGECGKGFKQSYHLKVHQRTHKT